MATATLRTRGCPDSRAVDDGVAISESERERQRWNRCVLILLTSFLGKAAASTWLSLTRVWIAGQDHSPEKMCKVVSFGFWVFSSLGRCELEHLYWDYTQNEESLSLAEIVIFSRYYTRQQDVFYMHCKINVCTSKIKKKYLQKMLIAWKNVASNKIHDQTLWFGTNLLSTGPTVSDHLRMYWWTPRYDATAKSVESGISFKSAVNASHVRGIWFGCMKF